MSGSLKTCLAVASLVSVSAYGQNLVVNGNFDRLTSDTGVAVTAADNYIINSGGNGGYNYTTGYNLTGWTNKSYVGVVYGAGLADSASHYPLLSPDANATYCGPAGQYRTCYLILRGSNDGTVWDTSYTVPASSPQGGNFFGADGNYYQGALTQTVNGLTVNQAYTLSFWSAGGTLLTGGGSGTNSAAWNVTLSNGSKQDVNKTVSTGSYSAVGGTSPWVQTVVDFTATASSEVLSFTPSGAGSPPMALLDGVAIMQGTNVVPAVPEPAQWTMLAAGMLFVWARLRPRRAASA